MQLFLGAVPTLRLFPKVRGHLLFSNIIPGIICQSLPISYLWEEKYYINFNGADCGIPPSQEILPVSINFSNHEL